MPLDKHNIEIIIVGDSRAINCEVGCGMDWSSAENLALAERQLKARFGDSVQLRYFDLAAGSLAPDLQPKIGGANQALPVLVVNGEPRISGLFDIRMLMDVVEAGMEVIP